MSRFTFVAAAVAGLVSAAAGVIAVQGPAQAVTTSAVTSRVRPAATTSTLVAASAPGEHWKNAHGKKGAAKRTYGNLGCSALDSHKVCTGGAWVHIPSAAWIWTARTTSPNEGKVTFTKTVTVTKAQAARKATLSAAADDNFSASLNGVHVSSGAFSVVTKKRVHLVAGKNKFTFIVDNTAVAYDPQDNPAGLAWKLTLAQAR